MFDKSLYRVHLENLGFVSTRAADLDKAIKKLHMAVCQIDTTPRQRRALEKMLNTDMRELITEFGQIEELRKDF